MNAMAKGNDGNLLQHWVEADLAARLHSFEKEEPLHIAVTHGMAPYEPFEQRKPGSSGFKKLDAWMAAARSARQSHAAPVVAEAYRACDASADHYPNSAEVLAAVVGRTRLRGSVTERDDDKFAALAARWQDSSVRVIHGSWRQHLEQHSCPEGLAYPWLFSMDPMTLVCDQANVPPPDDANLRPSDLALLEPVLLSYFKSHRLGAASIFCFSLQKKPGFNRYEFFKSEVARLAERLQCQYGFCEMPLSNPHVGAILSMMGAPLRK
jgi:hypothetical protein